MSKSFNELMNEASRGRTECALLVNFTRTFNEYAQWNLENELNSNEFDYIDNEMNIFNLVFCVDLDFIDLPINEDIYNEIIL